MKLLLLFFILAAPSYALVESEHALSNEPCPVKALSISNFEEPNKLEENSDE